MPTPKPEDLLADAIQQLPVTRVAEAYRRDRDVLGLHLSDELRALLQDAAAVRDLNPTAYVRRALYAFLAHDLHLDYEHIARDEPARRGKPKEHGMGHGNWVIEGLRKRR